MKTFYEDGATLDDGVTLYITEETFNVLRYTLAKEYFAVYTTEPREDESFEEYAERAWLPIVQRPSVDGKTWVNPHLPESAKDFLKVLCRDAIEDYATSEIMPGRNRGLRHIGNHAGELCETRGEAQ